MIDRPQYLEVLRRWRDRDVIKVVTGVRRCGKSTLLQLFADELASSGVPRERIVSINLEQLENEELLDYRVLHDAILKRASDQDMTYVFLDEVQNVPDFQKALDSLYTRPNIDLYVTGSNALLLGGTLATLLSGRYVEIHMTPLSFAEYASAHPSDGTSYSRLFSRYVANGGFPATISFEGELSSVHDYLEGIVSTVLFKDVAQRLNVSNTLGLDRLTTFMYDNIGNLTSAKGISDTLTSQGFKTSANTIASYLSGLANSYIVYPAKRYDVRGKRTLSLHEKFYGVDMGIRKILLSGQMRDQGRVLENVVYLELMRRNSAVYVGRVGDREVDFVTDGKDGRAYYQVSESVHDEKTLARELASLSAIRDDFPKYLLTMDDQDPITHNGIWQVNAIDWLLGQI